MQVAVTVQHKKVNEPKQEAKESDSHSASSDNPSTGSRSNPTNETKESSVEEFGGNAENSEQTETSSSEESSVEDEGHLSTSKTTIHIGNGSAYWRKCGVLQVQFDSPQTIRLVDVTVCYVSEVCDIKVPNFKSPNLVNKLHFDGAISQKNFNTLTDSLVNLNYLGIHLSSMETLDLSHKSSLRLPNLENLNVSADSYNELCARSINMNDIVDNVIALLKFHFPKIIYLSLSCPMVALREQDYTEAILDFLVFHKRTIKYLNLESLLTISSVFLAGGEDDTEENIELDFPPVQFDLSLLEGVHLKSFHLFFLCNTGSAEIWRNFLLTQNELDYCQFLSEKKVYPFYPVCASIVRKNLNTLQTFAFNFLPMDNNPVDCNIFKDAARLTTLLLKGYHLEPEFEQKTAPDLINFSAMPRSLRLVKILQLTMETKDLSFISTGLPELTRLFVEDIGEYGRLGISLKDLSSLVERKYTKKLQSICVIRAINRDSLEDSSGAQRPTDGYKTMVKILIKSQKNLKFLTEQNDDGNFDNIHNDEEEDDDHIGTEWELLEEDDCEIEEPAPVDDEDCAVLFCNDNPPCLPSRGNSLCQDEGVQACGVVADNKRLPFCVDECLQVTKNDCRPQTEDFCGQCFEELDKGCNEQHTRRNGHHHAFHRDSFCNYGHGGGGGGAHHGVGHHENCEYRRHSPPPRREQHRAFCCLEVSPQHHHRPPPRRGDSSCEESFSSSCDSYESGGEEYVDERYHHQHEHDHYRR